MLPTLNETRSARFVDRLTRRAALLGGAASLAALATRQASAQDATPVAEPSPVAEATPAANATPTVTAPVSLLFVQHAGPSTLVPGEDGVHLLTLGEVAAQSLYFSDRPNRVTGAEPTASFAAQFSQVFADSPPNATLIGHVDRGAAEEEAVVLTLLSAVYDAAAATLTYEVMLLEVEEITDRGFEQAPLTVLDAPRQYVEASLFIDGLPLGPFPVSPPSYPITCISGRSTCIDNDSCCSGVCGADARCVE